MGTKTVELIMKHFSGEQIEPEYLIPTELYRKADAVLDTSGRTIGACLDELVGMCPKR